MLQAFMRGVDRAVDSLIAAFQRITPAVLTRRRFTIAFLTLYALSYFFRLGAGDITDWDEGMYAWRAKVTVYLGGIAWLDQVPHTYPGGWNWRYPGTDKPVPVPEFYSGSFPPLLVWLMALAYKLFGISTFSARFCSALAGVAAIFGTWLLTSRLTRNAWAGFWAAFILGSIFHFTEYARKAQFEGLMVCMMTWCAAFYVLWLEEKKWRWLFGCGAALGLAIMSKIMLPLFIGILIGILGLYHVYAERGTWQRRLFLLCLIAGSAALAWSALPLAAILLTLFALGFLINSRLMSAFVLEQSILNLTALAVALPWHLFMTLRHGRLFWDWYIGYHVLLRSQHTLDGHIGNWMYYLAALWKYLPAPALALILLGLGWTLPALWFAQNDGAAQSPAGRRESLRERLLRPLDPRRRAADLFFPAIWFVLPLMMLTFAETRRQAYMLLIYPAAAALAGVVLNRLLQSNSNRLMLTALTGAVFLTIASRTASLTDEFYQEVLLKGADEALWRNVLLALKIFLPVIAATAALIAALRFGLHCCRHYRALLFALLFALLTVFNLREWREVFAFQDKSFYGWNEVEPLIRDYAAYDLLVFWGAWDQPTSTYYLEGLHGMDRKFEYWPRPFQYIKNLAPDAAAQLQRLPRDRDVLLILQHDVLKQPLDRAGWEFVTREFRKTPVSKRRMANGRRPMIEAWFRPAQAAASSQPTRPPDTASALSGN